MSRFGYTSLGFGSGASAAPAFSDVYSVAFDGSNDYLTCGTVASLASVDEFGISFWYKAGTATLEAILGTGYATASGSSITFYTYTTNIYFHAQEGSDPNPVYITTTKPSTGNWHHIVGNYASSALELFIDGSIAQTGAGVAALDPDAGDNFKMGTIPAYPSYYGNVSIDEVAFFASPLTSGQVTNIWKGETNGGSGGTNGTPGDLSTFSPDHWWRMGDGDTYDTISDTNGEGIGNNDGTMINMDAGDIVEDVP
jgi:hypothetical protein